MTIGMKTKHKDARRHKMLPKCSARGTQVIQSHAENKLFDYHRAHTSKAQLGHGWMGPALGR
jgi:hypothetical protein